jgi:peptide/nickel transport system ATP-binding protein
MTALNPLHRVGDQIIEVLQRHRDSNRRAARGAAITLLDRVGIADSAGRIDAYPHQLSGGQRQRVMIAIALACEPALLIADEPTTALDSTMQRQILDLMAGLVAERHMAWVLISHDLGVIAENVDRVAVMYAGQIVEQGPTGQVLSKPAHPYTRALLQARPRWREGSGLGAIASIQSRDVAQRLPTIPGTVPDSAVLPPGCPFAPRCRYAEPRCSAAIPLVQSAGADHRVRCMRASEINDSYGKLD